MVSVSVRLPSITGFFLRWRFLRQIICAVVPQLSIAGFKNRPNSGSIATLPSRSICRFMQVYIDSLSTSCHNDVCQSYSYISNLSLCANPSFVERVQSHLFLGIFDATDPLTALSTNHVRICTAKKYQPLKVNKTPFCCLLLHIS
jgi:hypothetical protein